MLPLALPPQTSPSGIRTLRGLCRRCKGPPSARNAPTTYNIGLESISRLLLRHSCIPTQAGGSIQGWHYRCIAQKKRIFERLQNRSYLTFILQSNDLVSDNSKSFPSLLFHTHNPSNHANRKPLSPTLATSPRASNRQPKHPVNSAMNYRAHLGV